MGLSCCSMTAPTTSVFLISVASKDPSAIPRGLYHPAPISTMMASWIFCLAPARPLSLCLATVMAGGCMRLPAFLFFFLLRAFLRMLMVTRQLILYRRGWAVISRETGMGDLAIQFRSHFLRALL